MILEISPNFQISLTDEGDASLPTLILLHAFPLSSKMWQGQIAAFKDNFRVLAPDFRGLGETTPFESTPSTEQLARDVEALLDALSIERAVIGGCSMGGYVAFEFVRLFPERLSGLLLCDTRADADSSDARQARAGMIETVKQGGGAAVGEKMLPKLLAPATIENSPDTVAQVRAMSAQITGEQGAQIIEAVRDRPDSTPILGSIAVPALLVCGSEDPISPLDFMAAIAAQIPNARHEIIEGAGHLPNLEQVEEFNRVVASWLRQFK